VTSIEEPPKLEIDKGGETAARRLGRPSALRAHDACRQRSAWPTTSPGSSTRIVYRRDGYDHATAEGNHVMALGSTAAFVDVAWKIHRAEGAAPREFHTAYNLRRGSDRWRITVCTAYEESLG
jgi:hypothetical protein